MGQTIWQQVIMRELNSVTVKYKMFRGIDKNKDQTYFLNQLTQEQLSKVMFPIGDLEKPKVREIAKEAGLQRRRKKTAQVFVLSESETLKNF